MTIDALPEILEAVGAPGLNQLPRPARTCCSHWPALQPSR